MVWKLKKIQNFLEKFSSLDLNCNLKIFITYRLKVLSSTPCKGPYLFCLFYKKIPSNIIFKIYYNLKISLKQIPSTSINKNQHPWILSLLLPQVFHPLSLLFMMITKATYNEHLHTCEEKERLREVLNRIKN